MLNRLSGKGWTYLPLVVVTLVMASSLIAFAATPATVTFWHALGSDHQRVLNQLVDEFNAANPDVVVQAEYIGNYGALQQKLISSVAAGRPPTLSLVYNNWTAALLEGEAIVPIATFVSDPQLGLSAKEIDDYLPAFVAANSWNGVWTTMPFNKSIYVLYYNKDLLDRAGVGVPATMNSLREAAKAVTEKTGVKGIAFQANVDQFGVFLNAFGGSWLGPDGLSAFHREAGVTALKYMQDLIYQENAAYLHDGYLDDEFNKGNTAMFIATVATIPWLSSEDHQWGAAPIPATSTQASVVQGTDLAIFRQATADEQAGAWRFVKWLTSPEVNARWAVETGYLPVRQSAVETALYQNYVNSAPEKYSAGVEQLRHAKFDPGLSAWFEARTAITQAVEEALILRTAPQAALDEAAARTDQAIRESL